MFSLRYLHGVVVADDALCVDAEDVVERAGEGDEGGAKLVLGRGREAGVVLWQEVAP